MTRYFIQWFLAGILMNLLFLAFQCASPEFTGAKVYIQQKNYSKADSLLELEVKKNPANEEAWYLLGGLKSERNDYEGMNRDFNEALELSKVHAKEIRDIRYNRWGTHLNVGVNYLERASSDSAMYFEKSIDEFQKAIAAWPDTALSYRYLGYAYNNKGDTDNALKAFKKAWELGDEESAKRLARIYIIFRGQGYKKEFENDNAEKLKAQKNLAQLRKNMRKTDVTQLFGPPDNVKKGPRGSNKEDWTYKRFKLTMSFDGDRVVNKNFSALYKPDIDSTKYKLALNEFEQAIPILEKVRMADPKDSESLTLLLQAYVEADRIKHAIVEFKKEVEKDPQNKNNRYILGVLYRSDGKYDEAIEQFEQAYKIDSTFTDAVYDLGASYYNWGVDLIRAAEEKDQETTSYKEKFQKALPYIEKVSQTKKDQPEIWETLGTIYARLGNQEKAMKAFERADKIRQGK